MYSKPTMKQRVLLRGQQGLELLHRISSADILGLSANEQRTGLILNPQGKIESFFEILRLNDESAEIRFEDGFLSRLEHYTFAEKYSIEALEPSLLSEIPMLERIRSLVPKEGFEFQPDGSTNPLEVNLRSAIADQKGCYPGQEVIEKIISLGSPARRLCHLKNTNRANATVANPVTPPLVAIDDAGNPVGTLTSACEGEGLAILKRTHCKAGQKVYISGQEWLVEKVAP